MKIVMTHISELSSPSESLVHKAIKQLVFKYISRYNKGVVESSLEKYFKKRRGDVYFKLRTGEEVVVEVQNSPISVKEVIERMKDYMEKDIFVLWILSGKGNAVASKKSPEHKKNVRISPVENFLHKIYGGRVYYVNVNQRKGKITLTPPYALHFSLSDTKSSTIYKEKFTHYYIRNVNIVRIPSWNLLCTEYTFKIARFYDTNAATILKRKMERFILKHTTRTCQNCQKHFKFLRKCSINDYCDFKPYHDKKLLKLIMSHFNRNYGKYIILKEIGALQVERSIPIKEKIIEKKMKKYL
ncbi:MAG: hypothetical protein EU547_03505 [Promethearchaeota archaeon]|nr:MAG: hypothetical protein EU547_03505 [Candidatus Lokiarchaeota archaeon]